MIESLFPMIPISDLVSVMHQGINTAADKIEYSETGTPIIQSRNLTSGVLEFSDVKYLGEMDSIKYKSKYVPEVGDILFSNIGTVGKSIVLEESANFMFAWNVFLIRPNHEIIDKSYFKYYLDYLDRHNYYEQWFTGGTVKFLNKKTIGNFKIPLPPLAEQKRIAAILDKADAIRRKRQQAIKLADEFLRSVFLDMFGDPVTNPKGWEVKTFGEVCSCSQGVQIDSELQLDKEQGGYSRFLRIINYTQANTDFKYIPTPQSKKAFIKSDEIVMVRYGATAGFVGRGLEGYLANNLFKISSNKVFFGDFLYFYLRGSYFQKILSDNKQGGAMPAISFGQINEINMYLPPLELQQKFAQVLHKVNLELEKQKKFLKFNLFESLSQKAFSGSL